MKYLGPISDPKDIVNKEYVDNSSGGGHEELTQAEYDELSQAEKENGTVYFITDGEPDYTIINDSVPIGAIQPYAGSTVPYGWLLCDGSAVSRETYSELFTAIGTAYGSGDGSTTFNVPDLKGRTIVGVGESSATGHTNHTLGQSAGEETHTLTVQEMPIHGHVVNTWVNAGTTGAAKTWTNYGRDRTTTTYGNQLANGSWKSASFQAAQNGFGDPTGITDTAGNSQPHSNMQPYVVTNYIIKAHNHINSGRLEELDPQHILFDMLYPVGSYYETSDSTFDPNEQWTGTWVDKTETEDVIIEEGTSGIWTYRKWRSGIAECWGVSSLIALTYVAWGSMYEANLGDFIFPSDFFTTIPSVSIQAMATGGGTAIMSTENVNITSAGVYGVYAVRPNSVNGVNARASIKAKGFWKTYTNPETKTIWHRTA